MGLRIEIWVVLIVGSLLFAFSARANVYYRPDTISEMNELVTMESMKMVFVPNSEVVWVNYSALRRDFPFLQNQSNSQINNWIIQNFSYVTENQLKLVGWRNTDIPHDPNKTKKAYRQSNYERRHREFQGRGSVFEATDYLGQPAGLVDTKGNGISDNKLEENLKFMEAVNKGEMTLEAYQQKKLLNGLMFLGDAMKEVLIMSITQAIFEYLNRQNDSQLPEVKLADGRQVKPGLQTIESYFLLKLPFNVLWGTDVTPTAATIHGRQAHLGRTWLGNVFHPAVNIKQADFAFAAVDGETVKLKHDKLKDLFNDIPFLRKAEHGFDPAEELEKAFNKNPRFFYDLIAETTSRVEKLDGGKGTPTHQSIQFRGMEAALDFSVKMIESEPFRFARGIDAILFALDKEVKSVQQQQPVIEKIAQTLLQLDNSVMDNDGSNEPVRKWGVVLIPTLKDAKARKEILRVEMSGDNKVIKDSIASVVWMFEPAEINPYLKELLETSHDALLHSLTRKLRQGQTEKDSRYERVLELYRRALTYHASSAVAFDNVRYFKPHVQEKLLRSPAAKTALCQNLFFF